MSAPQSVLTDSLPERPDNSASYDDDTLIGIISERFHSIPRSRSDDAIDPITYRDIAWILALCDRYRAALIAVRDQYPWIVRQNGLGEIVNEALKDTRPSA